MYKILKHIGSDSLFYTISNSIEAFSPIFLAIILTRIITPQEYGSWVLFIALVTVLRPLVNMSIQDALRMQFYEMSEWQSAQFIWSAVCLTTLCAGVLVALAAALEGSLSIALSMPRKLVLLVPVTAYLYAMFYFLLAYNQFAHNRRRFLLLHIIQTGASVMLIALFVLAGWGWPGVVVGKISGLTLGCAVGTMWLLTSLPLKRAFCNWPNLGQLAKFGLYYLPTGMGLVVIPLTDRLIVTHAIGLKENGYYGVAALFGSAVFVALNGFLHAWMPWLFRNLQNWHSRNREIITVSLLFLSLLPFVGLIAQFMVRPIAPLIIGTAFNNAFDLIPWAIAGTISMGYFYHNQAYLLFKKAILPMSLSSLTCIITNAIGSYYGAIHYGMIGVLGATIAAFLISAMISAAFMIPRYSLKLANV